MAPSRVLALFASLASGAEVSLSPLQPRVIGGRGDLDRTQWFNIHSDPNKWAWDKAAVANFTKWGAHLGRTFAVSYAMSQASEDAQRKGFVDKAKLVEWCKAKPVDFGNWPQEDVDMVTSSKTEQLFENGCKTPPKRPEGFIPGSPAAVAEFWAIFYQHCLTPTKQPRHLVEVANECDVKTDRCGQSIQGFLEMHRAVAGSLHAIAGDEVKVCGPVSAWPEWQLAGFKLFRERLAPYLEEKTLDCLSVHFYDSFPDNVDPSGYNPRAGSNLEAILDLQEAYSLGVRGSVMPLLVSEFAGAVQMDSTPYLPLHDFWIMHSTSSILMQFLDRPDRVVKAVPFIVNKAQWFNAGPNASHSYPWALWRNPSGDGRTWLPTHLNKFYEAWGAVRGSYFTVESSDLNVQVQGFRVREEQADTVFVVLKSLSTEAAHVDLKWAQDLGDLAEGSKLTELFLSGGDLPALGEPQLSSSPLERAPASVSLRAWQLSVLELRPKARLPQDAPAVLEETIYGNRTILSLASAAEAELQLPARLAAAGSGTLRLGLGGHLEEVEAALKGLEVEVNGVGVPVDEAKQLRGTKHTHHRSFFGALEMRLDPSCLKGRSLRVKVSTSSPGQVVLSSIVAVVRGPAAKETMLLV